MKHIILFSIAALLLTACNNKPAKTAEATLPVVEPAKTGALPKPAHVLVLILENHSYNQIFESKDAPDYNALAKSPQSVLFTQSLPFHTQPARLPGAF